MNIRWIFPLNPKRMLLKIVKVHTFVYPNHIFMKNLMIEIRRKMGNQGNI